MQHDLPSAPGTRGLARVLGACLVSGVAAAALAAPATAAPHAKAQTRAVVSVDRAHHALEVVDLRDRKHRASLIHYRGRVAGKLVAGAKVSYVVKGKGKRAHAEHVRVLRGHAARLTVRGKVVRHGRGLGVRLPDGRLLPLGAARLAGKSAAGKSATSIVLQGFDPGDTVDVSLGFDTGGSLSITITIVHGDSTAPRPGDPISAEGDVTRISLAQGAFLVGASDGKSYAFSAGAGVLNSIVEGDHVVVVGHYMPDLTPKADFVDDQSGDSTDPGGDSFDLYGTVVDANADAGTISLDEGDGGDPDVIVASQSLLDSVTVGDCVHVTAHLDDNGDIAADAIDQAADACADPGFMTDASITGDIVDISEPDVDGNVLVTIEDADGGSLVFHTDAGTIDGFQVGDAVTASGTFEDGSDTDVDLDTIDFADPTWG